MTTSEINNSFSGSERNGYLVTQGRVALDLTSEHFALDCLHSIANDIADGHTLDELLANALNLVTEWLDCEACFTFVLKQGRFEPWIWKTQNPQSAHEIGLQDGIKGALAEYKVPVAISATDYRRIIRLSEWSSHETSVFVPLLSRARLVGAINLIHPPHSYSRRDVQLLSSIGSLIGTDIGISLAEENNAALREDLETRKLVDRGTGLLQRDLRVSEQQAYLILEHLSRQRRKSVKEIACSLILAEEVKRGAATH